MDVRSQTIAAAQAELGMAEGFDIGLEMSGNGAALTAMVDNMAHGGRIALLGIGQGSLPVDWNQVVFNMITIKGIYGREMYQTWYSMTVMLQSGLDVNSVITHRYQFDDFESAFATAASGDSGKIVLNLDR